jgi:hypothetical protein
MKSFPAPGIGCISEEALAQLLLKPGVNEDVQHTPTTL